MLIKRVLGTVAVIVVVAIGSFLKYQIKNGGSDEAIKFNDALVEFQVKVINSVQALDQKLVNTDTKESSIVEINKTKTEIDGYIKSASELGSVSKGDDLKATALDLFNYYNVLLDSVYTQDLMKLVFDEAPTLTQEQFLTKYDQIFAEANANLQVKNMKFIDAQKKFANEYNITLIDQN